VMLPELPVFTQQVFASVPLVPYVQYSHAAYVEHRLQQSVEVAMFLKPEHVLSFPAYWEANCAPHL